MELLSTEFVSALLAIVAIDLVLAGDNAIVIALVARRLPRHQQRITIIAGTAGALLVRVLMTMLIVWLLNIPWLQLAGGILLIWIATKLLAPDRDDSKTPHLTAGTATLWTAVRTIVLADAVMGLDNVLGVAGAAHGDFVLVMTGLLISVPIMIFGSTLILKWVDRYPAIIYIGGAILAWTAVKMIVSEAAVAEFFNERTWLAWTLYIVVIGGVLASGLLRSQRGRELSEVDHMATEVVHTFQPSPAAAPDAVWSGSAVAAVQSQSGVPSYPSAIKPAVSEEEKNMLRILVPVDGSRVSLDAVAHVAALRRRSGEQIKVNLINVQPRMPRYITRFVSGASVAGFMRERADGALQAAVQTLERAGIPFEVTVGRGEIAQAIVDCARQTGSQKIVMGTARKSGLTRLLEDSVTNKVIELSGVPVEVVARAQPNLLERFGIPAGVGVGLAWLLLEEL